MTWVGVVFATSLLALLGVLSGGAGAQTRTPPKVTAPHKARPNAAPKGPGESVAQQRLRKRGYLVADEKALADAKGIAPPPLRSRLTAGGPLVPSASRSWEGVNDSRFAPSDSTGAIGPTRYIELVNTQFGIYDRSNDSPLSSGDLQALTGVTSSGLTDPQVIWDDSTQRFYFVVLDFTTSFLQYGYSKTDSPSGASDFCTYTLDFGYGSELPDYPKLGDTANFLLVGVNVFDQFDNYDGSDALSISKPPSGTSCSSSPSLDTTAFLKTASTPFIFTPVPANQSDGSPSGWIVANNLFAAGTCSGNGLVVFPATESGGSVTIPQNGTPIGVSSFSCPPNAPQPGVPYKLDTLDGRFTQAQSAIDPTRGGVTTIWTQHSVAGGAGSQDRWYEVNPAAHTILQSGSVSSGSLYVFNGAIAPDRVHNGSTSAFGGSMVLGFDTSSSSAFPAVEMVAKVGAGTQSGFVSVQSSGSAELDGSCFDLGYCRWGDYAAATPDPVADTTAATGRVWLTSMFAGGSSWRTWNWAAGANTPGISSFTPTSGTGGTLVTINGTAFTGATDVTFGGVSASFTVVSDSKITATVPVDAPGLSPIAVTTPLGRFTSATAFKALPKLTLASPNPAQAGDTVTLTGSNLTGASVLKLGSSVLAFTFDSATQLHFTVPDSALTNNLAVTTPGGTSAALKLSVRPTITGLSLLSGASGASVTLTGKTFTGTSKVTFGSPTATASFSALGNTQLKATVPTSAVTGPITVTNAGGSTVSADTFHVLPKVTSFSPSSGVAGTVVTITGTGLAGTSDVSFHGASSSTLSSITATSVKATVPAEATVGQIQVTTGEGSAQSAASFKPLPKLTLASPNPAQAGDTVTLTGSNLTGASVLKLGSSVLAFTFDSATQLHFTVPDSALTNNLAVTTPGGTSAALKLSVRPTITGFTPDHSQVGASITITGNTFSGTTAVRFTGLSGTVTASFSVTNTTTLKVTVPSAAITGPVSVTNAGGPTTSGSDFVVNPKVTSFSPSAGPVGTTVTINGSGFDSSSAVNFGGTDATTVTVVSAVKVTAVVPLGATTGVITVTTTDGGTAASASSFTIS